MDKEEVLVTCHILVFAFPELEVIVIKNRPVPTEAGTAANTIYYSYTLYHLIRYSLVKSEKQGQKRIGKEILESLLS